MPLRRVRTFFELGALTGLLAAEETATIRKGREEAAVEFRKLPLRVRDTVLPSGIPLVHRGIIASGFSCGAIRP